jgi:nucleotide-binding universal stress UspA family protein
MVYKRILTPLDFSPSSEVVFNQALEIAQQNQATLMLLHCIPFESYLPHGSFFGEAWGNLPTMLGQRLEKEKERTTQTLSDYAQKAQNQGLTVEWDWKLGEAGGWIQKISEAWQADLIVLGRRGLRGLSEVFLGSVSNYVVHHVTCSVLIVPLKES